MLTLDEALSMIGETVKPTEPRDVPLVDALGCRLATDIVSTIDSPPFDKSMMDGYAVRNDDLSDMGTTLRLVGEVTAGQTPQSPVGAGEAVRIMTGAPIPPGADAVVPIEWTRRSENENEVYIDAVPHTRAGWNIVPRGQSMRAGECVIGAGEGIRAQEIALLAEIGQAHVSVRRPPTIAILATGDELVSIDDTPGPGQIRNSNAVMLAAQVTEAGAVPRVLGIARDDPEELQAKIDAGLNSDFLCLSGGVSAGKLDLVPAALERAGVREVFHKVSMKPGKPIWFGIRGAGEGRGGCYVFGLPGNPVSSMVCFELFVRCAIRRFLGDTNFRSRTLTAEISTDFEYESDRPTWLPARVQCRDGRLYVDVVRWQGSSDIRSTRLANASVCLPAGRTAGKAGSRVDILPWGRTMECESAYDTSHGQP